MISDYHGAATRSRAMGAHQTSVYVGTIAGGAFAGLIGEHYGWRWSFLCFGALGISLGFVLIYFLREPVRGAADCHDLKRVSQPGGSLPLREFLGIVWGAPTALMLMAAFACANFVALVLLSWMPAFLYGKFHLSLAAAGLSATIFVQLASMAGSPLGGWLADLLHKRSPAGRAAIQAAALFCGAPFVVACGLTRSIGGVILSLTLWGFFKGLYDSNIFAALFDVIPPEARGTAAGFMNMVGWLGGGGIAPVAIGYIAGRSSLSIAISLAGSVYVLGGILLLIGIFAFLRRDSARAGLMALRA
jgi:MFS family permease